MRRSSFVVGLVLAVACSSSTTNEAPNGSGGSAGAGGGATGGASGSGGSGGETGGSSGIGGTGGAQGGSGGVAGSGGNDAALGGAAGTDASLGGTGGADASLGGSAGTDASLGGAGGVDASLGGSGGAVGGAGGSAGGDAGDASGDAIADASDGAAGGDAGGDASGDAGADGGDAGNDAPAADAGACPSGLTGGNGVAHYPLWKLAGDPRPDSEFTASANVVLDHTTCLMWQRAPGAAEIWDNAKTTCDNSTLDGYTDWRLPTRAELISLIDFTRIIPALNPTMFPGVSNNPAVSARFWASTVLASDATKRWAVVHGSVGQMSYLPITDSCAVRCVRGTGAPTGARFDTSTAGVIKDNETQLTWEAAPPNVVHTLTDATNHCAALGLVGGGWRLPTIRELATLIDPLVFSPALPAYFNALNTWFWTKTPAYNSTPPQNWAVQMNTGFSQPELTYSNPRTRCVR